MLLDWVEGRTLVGVTRDGTLSAAFIVPILLGATVGFFALRDAPELITLSVLALTGGALTAVVIEEVVSEAHRGETSRLGPLALTGGFAAPSPSTLALDHIDRWSSSALTPAPS